MGASLYQHIGNYAILGALSGRWRDGMFGFTPI